MNRYRYLICGGISLAIHSIVLSATPQPKELGIFAKNSTSSISIQISSQKKAVNTKPVDKPKFEKKETQTAAKNQRIEKEKTQTVAKKQPIKKVAPKKVVKKKPVTKKQVEPKVAKNQVKKTPPKKEQISKPEPKIEEAKPIIKEVAKVDAEKTVTLPSAKQVTTDSQSASIPKLKAKAIYRTKATQPVYPRLARKRGQQGKVIVEVWIDEEGNQTKRFIATSSGFSSLDNAAIKTIAKWKFGASIENGQAIAHRIQIPVKFKLD